MAGGDSAPVVLVAVGDELLSGHTQDTNSSFVAGRLFETGHAVRRIEVVADDDVAIAGSVHRALEEPGVRFILVSGGIGPTPDDHTFAAVAAALGRRLELNLDALAHIQAVVQRLHAAGWLASAEVSDGNRRAAMLPAGATVIENRRGMSPAIVVDVGGRLLFVLPGIPRELTTIVEEQLIPRYFAGGAAPVVRELRYTAVPEALMDEPMRTVVAEYPEVSVGSYPQSTRRELVIRFRGAHAGAVDGAARRFRELRPDGGSEGAG